MTGGSDRDGQRTEAHLSPEEVAPATGQSRRDGNRLRNRLRPGRGGLSFVLQAAGTVLSFGTQTTLARILGPLAFGEYTYATNFAQLASVPADLGGSTSVSRLLPEHRVRRQYELVRGVVQLSRLTALIGGLTIAGLAFSGSSIIGSGPISLTLLAVALVGVPLFALTLVQMNLLRALGEIFWALAPYLTFQPIVLLLLCLAPWVSLTAMYVVTATVASMAALAGVQAVLIRRSLRKRGLLVQQQRAYDLGGWRRITLPLLTINLIQLVFQKMDIIAVGVVMGARSAGIYALANRVAGVTSLMANSYAGAIAPQIAELHWSGRTDAAERLVLRTLRTTVVPAALVFLAIVFGGGHVMAFFGQGYVGGTTALVAYSAGQLVSVSFGPVGYLAAMIGQERAMASWSAQAAVIALVGYAVLIPTLGLLGAALANAIGIAYRNLAARHLVSASGYHITLVRAFSRSRRT